MKRKKLLVTQSNISNMTKKSTDLVTTTILLKSNVLVRATIGKIRNEI